MRYATRINPVTPITAFLPTEDCQNDASRFIARLSSPVHHRLHASYGFGRLVQVRPLLLREGDLQDPLQPLPPHEARHPAEHVAEAELALEPGGARQDSPAVEG